MGLQSLLAEGKLRPHQTSRKEVADLLTVVRRDLADAAVTSISDDRRFATAYNAALALATIALHAAGYRAAGVGHHATTFQVLPEIMGPEVQPQADYFDLCRSRRNTTDYDRAGEITNREAEELLEEAVSFRDQVLEWLRANHSGLLRKARR